MNKIFADIKGVPQNIQDRITKFINTIGDNRRYEIKNESADESTIYLYDVIGEDWFGGISAQQFAEDLSEINSSTIHLRINSPGGNVFDARAMQVALNQHDAKIIAHIDGLAASAATYIMLAADEIEAVEGALIMIHNAWGLAIGNKNDMTKMADTLAKIDEGIANDYINKTGQSANQIETWMNDETDFTAQEALDNGFIDRIYTSPKAKATKRDAEKALRDAGISAKQAKIIVSEGFNGSERDAADDDNILEANNETAEAIQHAMKILTRGA